MHVKYLAGYRHLTNKYLYALASRLLPAVCFSFLLVVLFIGVKLTLLFWLVTGSANFSPLKSVGAWIPMKVRRLWCGPCWPSCRSTLVRRELGLVGQLWDALDFPAQWSVLTCLRSGRFMVKGKPEWRRKLHRIMERTLTWKFGDPDSVSYYPNDLGRPCHLTSLSLGFLAVNGTFISLFHCFCPNSLSLTLSILWRRLLMINGLNL